MDLLRESLLNQKDYMSSRRENRLEKSLDRQMEALRELGPMIELPNGITEGESLGEELGLPDGLAEGESA
jgi:hypothetical protein